MSYSSKYIFSFTARLAQPAIAAAVAALCTSAPVFAQNAADTQQPPEEVTLGQVTVQADALARSVDDLTTPADVLTGDELVQRRGANLGDTLSGEPGIQATHFGAGASRPVIRGMDGARVKVLQSGAAIQDASTVSPDHLVTTEPMLARQIEVLRGPSALIYGAGAIGGVVNVLDDKIPTAVPKKGYEGQVEMRAGTGGAGAAGAVSVTGGSGNFAIHAEGMARNAQDYRVGSGWEGGGKVAGSRSRGNDGSVGLSWIGDDGSYLGAAYTRQTANYGLPGHNHGFEGCHLHGLHLHCGGHDHGDDEHEGHDHDHESGDVPVVRLKSERYDLRGEWRNPVAGISAVRLRGGVTDYKHDEVEDGAVATTFRNRAHDLRLEAVHEPIAGWTGVFGLETSRRRFSAVGEEAYLQPTITRQNGLFLMEQQRFGDVSVEAAVRHDWQSVDADEVSGGERRSHHGTSASVGAGWRFAPGWRLTSHLTTATRMPTAEELYANGLHMATATYELGNSKLRAERSNNIDLGLERKFDPQGNTIASVNLYRNHIANYIYGKTVDAVDGLQLLQYSQQTATFTGLEAKVQHKINANWRATVWGDMVHARLDDGSHIPRLSPARVGLRLAGQWEHWRSEAEWTLVKRQNKVAEYETETPGYGMLGWRLSYHDRAGDGSPWQVYLTVDNLTDKLAYAHTSYIKNAAPLRGRSVTVGFVKQF